MSEKTLQPAGTACQGALAQLFRTYNKLYKNMQAQLDKHRVTQPQLELMSGLRHFPGSTQQEVAERLNVTKGNVTGLIDRLAERGFVERRTDADDRRINPLYLTDAGQAVLCQILPEHARIAGQVLAALSDEEQQTLTSLLARLEQAL